MADPSVDHIDPNFKGKSETENYHNSSLHRYVISKSILNADVIINVAKMKTHCKAGVTLTLKNMIGIVYGKACMPHHRQGPPPDGDSFPYNPPKHYVAMRKIYKKLRKWIRLHRWFGFRDFRNYLHKNEILLNRSLEHGNWKGNDTIWRTILDLNRAVIYANKEGEMCETPQRKMFCFIDGIIAQEGNGPMGGDPVVASIVLGGVNPVAVDELAIKAMGIDPGLIKSVSKAGDVNRWELVPKVGYNVSVPNIKIDNLNFKLPKGWS